jgi:RND family efflux transporter MFP subunit
MKQVTLLYVPIILVALFSFSCSKKADTKKVSPSSIENPVKESDLTTIRLTDQAITRLGIQTKEIVSQATNLKRTYSGEVIAVPGRSMTLMAPVSGTILGLKNGAIPLAGAAVKKGQSLYRILILPSEKDLISAQEDVKLKKVQFDVASEKLRRAEQLLKDKAGSVRNKQDAEAELANITAQLHVSEARVQLMNGNSGAGVSDKLSTLNIESSVDGFIQKVYVSPSQVVSANAPVMDIASVTPIWIRVPVYAGDISLVNRKNSAFVRSLSDFNGSAGEATATPIDGPQTADPLTSSADLFYELPNKDVLFRPGQKVSVSLPFKQEQTSLVIPFSAIVYDIQGGTWVYENSAANVYTRRRVEVSSVENGMAVLRRGPSAGTKIVIEGVAELFGTEFGGAK